MPLPLCAPVPPLHNWFAAVTVLPQQEALWIFFPSASATQAPTFENFARGPVINTLVACKVWLSQGHAAFQWQRYNRDHIPRGWSLTATPGHPSPLLLWGRLRLDTATRMFVRSVPLHPVLPVLFDSPQFLSLLPWAVPLPSARSGRLKVVSYFGRFSGNAHRSGEHRPSHVVAAVREPLVVWHWWYCRRWTLQFPEFNTCR